MNCISKLFILLVLITGCKSVAPVTVEPEIKDRSGQVAFLLFRIAHDSITGYNSLKLTDSTLTYGQLKKQDADENPFAEYLRFDIFESGKPVLTQYIQHPLSRPVEYITEEKQLAVMKNSLPFAEFFIRVQLSSNKVRIKISEKLNDSELKILNQYEL